MAVRQAWQHKAARTVPSRLYYDPLLHTASILLQLGNSAAPKAGKCTAHSSLPGGAGLATVTLPVRRTLPPPTTCCHTHLIDPWLHGLLLRWAGLPLQLGLLDPGGRHVTARAVGECSEETWSAVGLLKLHLQACWAQLQGNKVRQVRHDQGVGLATSRVAPQIPST